MILASVPCIMVCHDLARLTMIMTSVLWLGTLGPPPYTNKVVGAKTAEKGPFGLSFTFAGVNKNLAQSRLCFVDEPS